MPAKKTNRKQLKSSELLEEVEVVTETPVKIAGIKTGITTQKVDKVTKMELEIKELKGLLNNLEQEHKEKKIGDHTFIRLTNEYKNRIKQMEYSYRQITKFIKK